MASKRLALRVIEIKDETADSYSLYLESSEPAKIYYESGQYLTLITEINEEGVRRAYSLSSSPEVDQNLRLTIKRVEGGVMSNYLRDNLREGQIIEALQPKGSFTLSKDITRSRHYLLFAAGSGITPLFSIIKTLLSSEPLSRITLWYGSRHEEDIILKDELDKWQEDYPDRFDIHYLLSRPGKNWEGEIGRVNEEYVYQEILELFMRDEYRKQYYLCGPPPMMAEVSDALERHAVHPADIHREYFNQPLPEEDEAEEEEELPQLEDRRLRIKFGEETFEVEVSAEQSILDAAIAADLDPPFACMAGLCTSCKARKLSGEVYMENVIALSEKEIEEGYILTCQAHPLVEGVEIDYEFEE